jgi:tetratricopeptide (TPR) repeat protein
VLLLLDVWPLGRISLTARPKARVFWEKAPLLALAIGSSVVTYVAQSGAGAVVSMDSVPLARRLGNVVVSYLAYILEMFWPTRLAFFYPYPAELSAWQVGTAALALLAVTFVAICWLRRRPWFAVGWFWYVGTLVPMIGLVQVGAASHADRYMYLPAVGLWIMLAWGAAQLVERSPRAKPAVAALAAACCVTCSYLTWMQVQYWENSITLFRHAIQVTSGNYLAHNKVGNILMGMARLPDAIAEFKAALSDSPGYADAHLNLGIALENIAPPESPDRLSDAISEYRAALRTEPGMVKAHVNLGVALARTPELVPDAIAELQTAIRLQPDSAKAHECLGTVLSRLPGRLPDAIAEFQTAVRIDPGFLEAHYNLAYALAQIPGRLPEAIAECQEVLRINPGDAPGRQLMASLLAFRDSSGRRAQ